MTLFSILLFLGLTVFGHYFAAFFLYGLHRFVFHGKLRRYPGLKHLARLHGLHHAHISNDVDDHIAMPFWAKTSLLSVLVLTGWLINPGFALGIASFALLYKYRHWAVHHQDTSSRFYHHHNYHHEQNVLMNFSGIHPWIDRVFKTYAETNPRLEKK